jgi:CubicO group peptidase (beta-lactamase class C family)
VLADRVLGPLGMVDTAFHVPHERRDRLARLYRAGPDGTVADDALGAAVHAPPAAPSGEGGLVSTLADYLRFAEMLRRGGELDGVRVLGSRTVAHMTSNHLPGDTDLAGYGRPLYAETPFPRCRVRPRIRRRARPGPLRHPDRPRRVRLGRGREHRLLVDPVEDLAVVLLTQLMPPPALPIRPTLRQLVAQAIVD